MQNRINSSMQRAAKRTVKWASLPALAVAALVAGAPAASAYDQQATDDQVDYALSWGAATGGYTDTGPRAQAFREGRGTHQHRNYR